MSLPLPAPGARIAPLLVSLIGVCFLYSALNFGKHWDLWDGMLMSAMILAGGYTFSALGFRRRETLALTAPVLAFVWAEEVAGGEVLFLARHLAAMGFELVLGVTLLRAAASATRVDVDLVLGTASTYLLIGLLHAHAFLVLHQLDPDSIRGAEGADPLAVYTYYSFGSLTTLGTGDLVPVDAISRALTVGEAVIGNLFLAIIVARVVSMHVAHMTTKG